jgi:hypothetical protein
MRIDTSGYSWKKIWDWGNTMLNFINKIIIIAIIGLIPKIKIFYNEYVLTTYIVVLVVLLIINILKIRLKSKLLIRNLKVYALQIAFVFVFLVASYYFEIVIRRMDDSISVLCSLTLLLVTYPLVKEPYKIVTNMNY